MVYFTVAVLNQRKKIVTRLVSDNSKEKLTFTSEPEKINVVYDDCEFRDGNYLTEEEKYNEHLDLAGTIVGTGIGSFASYTETKETIQSALFYQNPKIRNNKRFHQLFPVEVTALKTYVLSDQLKLYIDRFDSNTYKFEINT